MHIESIMISNFRKLAKNAVIHFDKQTLIVGKNNTGKTSVSEIITKSLTSVGKFNFEDFSSGTLTPQLLNKIYADYENEIASNAGKPLSKEQILIFKNRIPSIILEVLISIQDEDNLAQIKELLFEFKNNSKIIIRLKFEFINLKNCVLNYNTYISSIIEKNNTRPEGKKIEILDFYNYIKRNFEQYFVLNAYACKPHSTYEMPVSITYVRSLFNIGIIAAQREVDDTSDQSMQTISGAIWNYYQKITKESVQLDHEDEYKNSINEIQESLNENYNLIFKDLIEQVNRNILLTDNSQKIGITSEFNIEDILKKNSKLKYNVDELVLPESYNGLGYSNLMYIFIKIITFKHKIERENKIFNLLFIEEPESHLHPQMQATFLNRVEDILQCCSYISTVITTHSSYILQSSYLDNIIYFLVDGNFVIVKSLKEFFLLPQYSNLKPFLKKYFRINTCDLFFTDKAILIEGSAERILMPIFKSMIDKTNSGKENQITKQHITTLEVGGAYAHKFYELLNFLGIKTLIITDIDSVSGTYNSACKCDLRSEGNNKNDYKIKTSNQVIKNWFEAVGEKLFLKDLIESHFLNTLSGREACLVKKADGYALVRLAFQLPNDNELYWGRTFEEQLIKENRQYLTNIIVEHAKKQRLEAEAEVAKVEAEVEMVTVSPITETVETLCICSLEDAIKQAKITDNLENLTSDLLNENLFEIVLKLNKTDFAFDLLMLDGWDVPQYIQEGLEWLKK